MPAPGSCHVVLSSISWPAAPALFPTQLIYRRKWVCDPDSALAAWPPRATDRGGPVRRKVNGSAELVVIPQTVKEFREQHIGHSTRLWAY